MKNFWKELKKPIFCLAPMADVTDCAFRKIIAKYGKPDIFFTEFVSADGLAHPMARKKLLINLKYSENEHPIVAQIFGSKPENIKTASTLCKELGFDGIDINMGCPDKSIEKQCAGAAMIKDLKLARKIIRAAKEGADGLSVSVKTRIGYNKNEIEIWIPALLREDLSALTVHLRTRKEMSKVPAHWDLMKRIVEIRNEVSPATLIIGNGDVADIDDARRKCKQYDCDGVMLGRAIFGNPWLFNENACKFFAPAPFPDYRVGPSESKNLQAFSLIKQKLKILLEHTKLFEKMLGKYKNFAIMKKHFKAYVNGFPACAGRDGAKELRMKLMDTENAKQVETIVNDFLDKV